MRVKICGITNLADAEAAIAAGADALGFILYAPSKRFIPIEEAIRIVDALPPFVQTVAVMVDATKEFSNLGWRKQLKHFNAAQLHGHESPVHARAVGKYLPVIKVFPAQPGSIASETTILIPPHMIETIDKLRDAQKQLALELKREPMLEELSAKVGHPVEKVRAVIRMGRRIEGSAEPACSNFASSRDYESIVSAFMLDTPSKDHGGTGRVFDWNLALEFKKRTQKPLILSGGLNPENIAKAVETVHPYAVDASSGVEISPGKKDHVRLRDFIQICKSF